MDKKANLERPEVSKMLMASLFVCKCCVVLLKSRILCASSYSFIFFQFGEERGGHSELELCNSLGDSSSALPSWEKGRGIAQNLCEFAMDHCNKEQAPWTIPGWRGQDFAVFAHWAGKISECFWYLAWCHNWEATPLPQEDDGNENFG